MLDGQHDAGVALQDRGVCGCRHVSHPHFLVEQGVGDDCERATSASMIGPVAAAFDFGERIAAWADAACSDGDDEDHVGDDGISVEQESDDDEDEDCESPSAESTVVTTDEAQSDRTADAHEHLNTI